MHRRIGLSIVIVLGLCLSLAGVALGLSTDPGQPEVLSNEMPGSGTLPADGGAVFAFYSIEYPGDGRVVTIRLKFTPADPVTRLGVGFNVYGPDGRHIGSGGPTAGLGVLELECADTIPASWLVQVYNYAPGQTVDYTIVVRGLPYAAVTPVHGTVAASWGAAFAYYNIDYPGDQRVLSMELAFSPWDPSSTEAVGFNVYGPDGVIIASGEPTDHPGVRRLEWSSDTRATWLIQIYNYWLGRTIHYSFVAKGLAEAPTVPPPTPPPPPGAQPDTAIVIPGPMSGSLSGRTGGAFVFYEFTYPGDYSEVRVAMTFQPDTPVTSEGVGFVIYGPSGEVARGQRTSTPGERQAAFSSGDSGTYLVQVYNYIEGETINYTITR